MDECERPTEEVESRIQNPQWSRPQQHALREMIRLRFRARNKLDRPLDWWLTQRGLEQASGSLIARYKAQQYFRNRSVFDLCSGIGGDLFEIARLATVTSVDRDELLIRLQQATASNFALSDRIEFRCQDATASQVQQVDVWHLDPDRRAGQRKEINLEAFSPDIGQIDQLLRRNSDAVLKLAPATMLPEHWDCAREWIGAQGECKQQLALFGCFNDSGSRKQVTLIAGDGTSKSFLASEKTRATDVNSANLKALPLPGSYLYEPHAAFFAAQMVDELAGRFDVQHVSSQCGYLAGDHRPELGPWSACFRIEGVYPMDTRRLKRVLKDLDVGELEIKKRGVPADWVSKLFKLKGTGGLRRTALVFPFDGKVKVAIGERQD